MEILAVFQRLAVPISVEHPTTHSDSRAEGIWKLVPVGFIQEESDINQQWVSAAHIR